MKTINKYSFKILKNKNNSLTEEIVQEKWITRWGGQIKIGNNEKGISSLTIYPGAISGEVLVRFQKKSNGLFHSGCELSPHGILFTIPVILRLSYQDADLNSVNEDDLKIFSYNEDSGEWEALISKVYRDKKEVIAFIKHFSRYAIG
jgi:hypothetical protein